MDVLGDILATLELRSSLYFRAELSQPFALAVPEDRQVIRFHIANHGSCWIGLPSGQATLLHAGDLVLVPHGAGHTLTDSFQTAPVTLSTVLHNAGFDGTGPLVFGGGGARTVLVCGFFAFAHEVMHPVLASLPPLLHFPSHMGYRYAWIEQLLAYLEAESRLRSEGWQEVVKRLSEIFFVCVLREYMGINPHSTGALMALTDAQLGVALRAIHADPAVTWSVATLAERAGMSRTAFAERFRQRLGLTPLRYVTLWRMHKARALLAHSGHSVGEIAWEVGYTSEAAFNRIFKAYFEAPPGRYRQQQDDEG